MNNQAINYEKAFYMHLAEDISAGDALGGSPSGNGIGPYDIEYAGGKHGDNRLPTGGKKTSKKQSKKKKTKRDGSLETLVPLQRRPFPLGL